MFLRVFDFRMKCLFCHTSHDEKYICNARCEARISMILNWKSPGRTRQLTIPESMPGVFNRGHGKKRPTPVVIATIELSSSDEEAPPPIKLHRLARKSMKPNKRRCVKCEDFLASCTW